MKQYKCTAYEHYNNPLYLPFTELYGKIAVINVIRLSYKKQLFADNHCHNFFHLLYVSSGESKITINGHEYKTSSGDIFIFKPLVYHGIKSDYRNPLETLEIKFLVEEDDSNDFSFSNLPQRINMKDNKIIRPLLQEIVKEAVNKQPFFKELLSILLKRVLVEILRVECCNGMYSNIINDYPNARDTITNDVSNEKLYNQQIIGKALAYIQKNYHKKISLTELSDLCYISHVHLCRIFNKALGCPPIQYINNFRLIKVRQLLLDTELSITDIANNTGFESIHYLSRIFTKKFRMSPTEYRRELKKNVSLTIEDR